MDRVHTEQHTQEHAPMLVPYLGDMTALARAAQKRERTMRTLEVLGHTVPTSMEAELVTHSKLHGLMLSAAEAAAKALDCHHPPEFFTKAATRWSKPEGGVYADA